MSDKSLLIVSLIVDAAFCTLPAFLNTLNLNPRVFLVSLIMVRAIQSVGGTTGSVLVYIINGVEIPHLTYAMIPVSKKLTLRFGRNSYKLLLDMILFFYWYFLVFFRLAQSTWWTIYESFTKNIYSYDLSCTFSYSSSSILLTDLQVQVPCRLCVG